MLSAKIIFKLDLGIRVWVLHVVWVFQSYCKQKEHHKLKIIGGLMC